MKIPAERKGRKYLKRGLVASIILAGIAYGAFYVWQQYESVDRTSKFDGEVVCLPLRSSPGPLDKETCIKGLRSKDRLYFVVRDVPQAALNMGEKIAIKGDLDPVTSEIDDYAVAGSITGELVAAKR